MIKTIFSIFISASVLISSSCATIIRGVSPNKEILISGYPEGANVYIKNKNVGSTPLTYKLKSRKRESITIKKEGFIDSHYSIKTKKSIGWTATSIGLGFFGMFIPTIIDAQTGALNKVLTDSIQYKLIEVTPQLNVSSEDNSIKIKNSLEGITYNEEIINSAIQIRTKSKQIIIQSKAAVTVWTNNGSSFSGAVGEIGKKSFKLENGDVEIQFSDLNAIRLYPTRRWYPVLTSITIIPPIIWYASSKKYKRNSNNCKSEIISIQTIDFVQQRAYGKPQCR
jgi:hypothetical protein